MWLAIPVKRFSSAKTRLAAVLSDAERESFAQVMLNDVLVAAGRSQRASGILVVSTEVRAKYTVERAGGAFIEESGSGLSAAVAQAADYLASRGEYQMLMIPGDVPLIRANEIDRLIEAHTEHPAVSLVPDRERDGTNALAVAPLDIIPFSFGQDSFTLHREAARDAGVEPKVLHSTGLALDIDTAIDLLTLLTYDSETESLAYLSDSDIARRLMPRHNGTITTTSRLI